MGRDRGMTEEEIKRIREYNTTEGMTKIMADLLKRQKFTRDCDSELKNKKEYVEIFNASSDNETDKTISNETKEEDAERTNLNLILSHIKHRTHWTQKMVTLH